MGTVNYMSPEAILNGQASALGGPMKVGRVGPATHCYTCRS